MSYQDKLLEIITDLHRKKLDGDAICEWYGVTNSSLITIAQQANIGFKWNDGAQAVLGHEEKKKLQKLLKQKLPKEEIAKELLTTPRTLGTILGSYKSKGINFLEIDFDALIAERDKKLKNEKSPEKIEADLPL